MNIKNSQVLTRDGPRSLCDEVFRGERSEDIMVLHGTGADVVAMFRDAQAHVASRGTRAGQPAKYGALHVKLSPKDPIDRGVAERIAQAWCREYSIPWDRCVLLEHRKRRAGTQGHDRHWHMVAPSLVHDRVVDMRNSRRRNEKLARLTEIELGYALIKGRHNRAVERALVREGKLAEATAVQSLTEGAPARSSFTSRGHQWAKRLGIDLAEVKFRTKTISQQADTPAAFVAGMAEAGLRIKAGRKADVFIIEAMANDGTWKDAGTVDRHTGRDRKETAAWLKDVDFEGLFTSVNSDLRAARTVGASLNAGVGEPKRIDGGRGGTGAEQAVESDQAAGPGATTRAEDVDHGSGEGERAISHPGEPAATDEWHLRGPGHPRSADRGQARSPSGRGRGADRSGAGAKTGSLAGAGRPAAGRFGGTDAGGPNPETIGDGRRRAGESGTAPAGDGAVGAGARSAVGPHRARPLVDRIRTAATLRATRSPHDRASARLSILLERAAGLACGATSLNDLVRQREEQGRRLAGEARVREDEQRPATTQVLERRQPEFHGLDRREGSRSTREEHWRHEIGSLIAGAIGRRDHHAERMWMSEHAMGMPPQYGLRVEDWLPLERATAADISAWEAEYRRRRTDAASEDARDSLEGEHLYVLEHGVPRAWRPTPKFPPIPPLFPRASRPRTGCTFSEAQEPSPTGGAGMADGGILPEACPEPPPPPPSKPSPWPEYARKLERRTQAALPRRRRRPGGTALQPDVR